MFLRVDAVEEMLKVGNFAVQHCLAHAGCDLLRGFCNLSKECIIGVAVITQVLLKAQHGVATQRTFQVGIGAVLGGVVRGGVRAEAVGLSFNQHGAFTGTNLLHGVAGRGEHRENVVAVHADTFKAVACGAGGHRHAGLHLEGHGDSPAVVLHEEEHRCVIGGGKNHGLVRITLGGGAVTEVDRHGRLLGVLGRVGCLALTGAADAGFSLDVGVEVQTHGVADCMQGLGGKHLGVGVEVVCLHVPAVGGGAAEDGDQVAEVHAARQGDGVLTVGGEDVVVGRVGECGADLCGFLASTGYPEGELTLALQGGCLVVESAGGVHEAVCLAQGVCVDVFDVPAVGGVFVYGAVFIHELDAFGHSRVLVVLVHLTSTRDEGLALSGLGFSLNFHLMVQGLRCSGKPVRVWAYIVTSLLFSALSRGSYANNAVYYALSFTI